MEKRRTYSSPFCREYLNRKDQFKWFIERYFGKERFIKLYDLALSDMETELYSELESIWFDLPDNIFNISVSPKGWSMFVELLDMFS